MILPMIRQSLERKDALHLVHLLGGGDSDVEDAARRRLEEEGIDSILDDPRLRNALLTQPDVSARPAVIFYVLVRQALLEGGVDSISTADYVASLVVAFGNSKRAYKISDETDEEFHHLADLVAHLGDPAFERALLLQAHLGNFSLWLAGIFPDYLEARHARKGAPPLSYYDEVGARGFRLAAENRRAHELGVRGVYGDVADYFHKVRIALNRISDRYLWAEGANPVNRLLREVSTRLANE